jgi:hypothetical protein
MYKEVFKYKYLKYELEDLIKERDRYSNELSKHVYFPHQSSPASSFSKKEKNISSKQLKEFFKALSKVIHPDKGGNMEDFVILKQSYTNHNIMQLLVLAEKYNITDDLTHSIVNEYGETIDKNISEIEKQIENIKKSAPMLWGKAEPEKKKRIENWLINQYNFKQRENF